MAKFAVDNLGVKNAAVLYDNGNDYVLGLAQFFKAAFEQAGGTVRSQLPPPGWSRVHLPGSRS